MPYLRLHHIFALFRSLWLRASAYFLSTPSASGSGLPTTVVPPPAARPPDPRAYRQVVPAAILPRHSRARNLKTKAKAHYKVKKAFFTSKVSTPPAVRADATGCPTRQVPSHSAQAQRDPMEPEQESHFLISSKARLAPEVSPLLGSGGSTPVLSPDAASSPALSTDSSLPRTPIMLASEYPLVADQDGGVGANPERVGAAHEEGGADILVKRRGFRGGRIFVAQPIRSFSSGLSPLSPLFQSPNLRRVSSFVSRTGTSPPSTPVNTGPDFGSSDPFSTYGDSFYAMGEDAEAAVNNLYDFAVYDSHSPTGASKTRPGSSRLKPSRSKLNIYEASMYESGIVPPFLLSKPAPTTPKSLTASAKKRARAQENARKRRAIYQGTGTFSFSSPVLPPIAHPAAISLSPSPSVRQTRFSTAAKDAEGLADRDYLRSIARSRFTPTTDGTPRSSVTSIFTERRHSTGLRPLILPQKLGLTSTRPISVESEAALSESEVRMREHATAEVREGHHSQQLDDIISLLDASDTSDSWVLDLERGLDGTEFPGVADFEAIAV